MQYIQARDDFLHLSLQHAPTQSQSLLKHHWSVLLGLEMEARMLPTRETCPLLTDIGYLLIRLAQLAEPDGISLSKVMESPEI